MPKIFHKFLQPNGEVGIWKIEEDEFFFLKQMDLAKEEKLQISKIKGHRRLEWLASRWLIHKMSGRKFRGAILKDENGKPYLQNSFYEVSISHSRSLAAVIGAPRAVGVDIQKLVGKIERIAHKFMRPDESKSLREDTKLWHLHVYWGAKEALYKAYGRRALDFKEHILIDPFEFAPEGANFKGKIMKNNIYFEYTLWYQLIDDFVLVYAMENNEDQRIA